MLTLRRIFTTANKATIRSDHLSISFCEYFIVILLFQFQLQLTKKRRKNVQQQQQEQQTEEK